MHRLIFIVALALLVSSSRAGTVDPPLKIKVMKLDRSELSGMIISYADDSFEIMDAKKQTTKISWDELPPDVVMNLHERLLRLPSGDDWFKLGKKLLTMPGGRAQAERAFGKAMAKDPKLKEQIQAARKEAALPTQPTRTAPGTPPGLSGAATAIEDLPTTQRSAFDPRDPQKTIIGPQKVGAPDPSAWGKLTPKQHADALIQLTQFATETAQKLNVKLAPRESQYFLVYSDLPTDDAQKWLNMLDRMYGRMSVLFGLPTGENIWRGKALVLIFSNEADYLKFQMKMHKSMAAGTAGMCHTFGSGEVHIAFYRQPNEQDFAHVLVHESIHAFLHRYRSAIDIPAWANEGLAEAIATDMVPRREVAQMTMAEARQELQKRQSLGTMFTSQTIVAWQYPVARTLTEYMLRTSRDGYVAFINSLKDGVAFDEAMRTKYGVTVEQLLTGYGNSMGVPGLKP